MKRVVLLLLFAGYYLVMQGQVVIITDKDNGQPLDLVTFSCNSPRAFALTNAQGEADISKFTGAEKIEVRLIGYKTSLLVFVSLNRQNS